MEKGTLKLMIIRNPNDQGIIKLLVCKAWTLTKAWYSSGIGIVRVLTKSGGVHL